MCHELNPTPFQRVTCGPGGMAGSFHPPLITEARGEGRATTRPAILRTGTPCDRRTGTSSLASPAHQGPLGPGSLDVHSATVLGPQAAARAGSSVGTQGLTGPPRLPEGS